MLISGVPSAGKTELRNFLRAHGATVLSLVREEGDDFTLESAGLRRQWEDFVRGASEEFCREVRKGGLVLEWGYPPACLPMVQRIHEAGIAAWWISGDLEAVRHSHAKAGKSVADFDLQAEEIRRHWPALQSFYGLRLIERVNASGHYLPAEHVCARIFCPEET